MNGKQMRSLFLKVRRVAAQLAEKCDFVTASRIKEAVPSCSKDLACVGVEYHDRVERAQITTAFSYGAELHCLSFYCYGDEDIDIVEGKSRLVVLNLVMEGK